MTLSRSLALLVTVLLPLSAASPLLAQEKEKPKVAIPQAGVPEIMTIEGTFVRAAYNNEGYVILGYQLANRSVGEEWLLLEVGMTVMDRVPNYTITPAQFSLTIPGGQSIPLPSVEEYRKGDTRALKNRERVQRDSINYFPPSASRACSIVFYPDLDQRAMPRDEIELSSTRACLGRLYFKVPGGIKYGQYWLDVKFEKSVVRVPFRILTEDEEKLLSKNYKDIRKQVQDAFKPKKK
ncbi:hypothetical protein LuPra_05150 [Luteitalea pratensis]|uniref:DUF4412 domain-containing protein n=1 Tax=Luteitalea pratensis TaxID=1855912 RepID=A0A143PTH3_LUTPR|nr:hypothetical protein [Luteitalea pratensis]AMY11882.1 hypothetical protein LuPra_05150 [Luteitalea pratensis]